MPRLTKCSIALVILACPPVDAASYYTQRPEDPKAVYLTRDAFGAQADGIGDDTDALQKAIDAVATQTTRGILFVPEGKYRLSKAIRIWPGVRVIGYGRARPTFVLRAGTPGFQGEPAYVFHFVGSLPGRPGGAGFVFTARSQSAEAIDFSAPVRDANPGTFYSALSNVDVVIEERNPGAVAVRATYAQHCFLAHMDFHLSDALAGIQDGGNVGEDLRFFGGKFGISTVTPSPGWQFTLVDTTFAGQSVAAIRSELSGLTLIRPQFRDVPTALSMSPELGEQLWIKDGRMERIAGPALLVGDERNSRNQINIDNLVADRVPVFAAFRQSGKQIRAPAPIYRVASLSHGLHIEGSGVTADQFLLETRSDIEPLSRLPPPVPTDIAALPPQSTWVNVRDVGVRGDAVSDETEALRRAIARHRTLYFPLGAYKISGTLRLRPDTVLIGLHAGATRIFLPDGAPAFQGTGTPVPMIEAPAGGSNIVMGLGVYTNGVNSRAVAVEWMAGARSLMNDVRFLGGHGTAQLSGEPEPIYNENRTADPDPARRWDSQYPSLWITNGGGGTFLDIWTPSPYAQAGLVISHTSTPGRIYQMSSEHHVRYEVKLDHVANWEIYALQLEEERGESGFALPVEIADSNNVLLANLFVYRVISSYQPFPTAVRVTKSRDIRFRGFHSWTNSKAAFDSAIVDAANGVDLRQHEFACVTLSDRPVRAPVSRESAVLEPGSVVKRLSGGFHRLAGGAVDRSGRFYAVDARWQRIYRWTEQNPWPELIADDPLEPVNLAFDATDHLLVVSQTGSVYALSPDDPQRSFRLLQPQPATARSGLTALIPQNYWTNGYKVATGQWPRRISQFVSADGSTFLAAGEDFVTGRLSWGVKDHDLLRAYALTPVPSGSTAYITLEWHGKTYAASVDESGNVVSTKLFAERGGEAVIADEAGNVYIADGQIFVHDPSGRLIEVITVPERPLGLAFGGRDRRTLYIPAGSSLFAVRISLTTTTSPKETP
jgi:Pectate lyase superfamily protein/SMP-30/Gluconolactonase/LRE-like region